MEKKGAVAVDFTTQGIVIFIFALVIIAFLGILVWGIFSNQAISYQSCQTSVSAKGIFNFKYFEVGKEKFPLNCQTQKICLSDSGDECKNTAFPDPSQDKSAKVVKLKADDALAKQQVTDQIIDAIVDCHTMLGGGQVNFLPSGSQDKNYCLVCDRIILDDKARELSLQISYIDLYQRMKQRKTNGGVSYLEAVYGVDKVSDMVLKLDEVKNNLNSKITDDRFKVRDVQDLKIDLTRENVIISEIIPKGTIDAWTKSAVWGGVVTAGIILLPVGGLGLAVLAGGTTAAVVYTSEYPDGHRYVYPMVYPGDVESLKSLKCDEFAFIP